MTVNLSEAITTDHWYVIKIDSSGTPATYVTWPGAVLLDLPTAAGADINDNVAVVLVQSRTTINSGNTIAYVGRTAANNRSFRFRIASLEAESNYVCSIHRVG